MSDLTPPANASDPLPPDEVSAQNTGQSSPKFRERFLVSLVSLLVVIANIPHHLLGDIGIDREIALASLGILIVLALFLYVRFFFFLLYVLLVIGANLPEHWAQTLGIDRVPLLIALACMVVGSSLNYLGNFMPTGLGVKTRRSNPDALHALFQAVAKQQLLRVRAILDIDFNLDLPNEAGETVLMQAVKTGNSRLVYELLRAGANPHSVGPAGTALDQARAAGYADVIAVLVAVSAAPASVSTPSA